MPARMLIVVVAGERGFDTPKGRLVHTAFLDSPDAQVVSYILVNSRHRLETTKKKKSKVGPLLRDKRLAGLEGLPPDVTVAECAAYRLARAVGGSQRGFPESQEDRKAQLAKWRKWWDKQE